MNPNWYAIHTLTAKEDEAKRALSQQSIQVFAPFEREKRKNGSKVKFVERPYFPRYIFAKFDAFEQSWKVNHSRGVSGIVCCGDVPSAVPDFLMEELYSRVGDDGYIVTQKKALGFAKNEAVKIIDGAWRDLEGLFQSESKGRVYLLLAGLMGGERIVGFDYSDVSAKVYAPIY